MAPLGRVKFERALEGASCDFQHPRLCCADTPGMRPAGASTMIESFGIQRRLSGFVSR